MSRITDAEPFGTATSACQVERGLVLRLRSQAAAIAHVWAAQAGTAAMMVEAADRIDALEEAVIRLGHENLTCLNAIVGYVELETMGLMKDQMPRIRAAAVHARENIHAVHEHLQNVPDPPSPPLPPLHPDVQP